MANLNDREYSNREINQRPDTPQNPGGNYPNPTNPNYEGMTRRDTPLPSNVAYRDGYTQGRVSQQRLYEADQVARDNDNAGRGLLLGILVTALGALALGAVFLMNYRSQTPTIIQRVVPNPSPSVQQSPQVRERVIERDRVVPVPQTEAPPPNINITVPDSGQQAPATAPVAPGTQSNTETAPSTTNPSTTSPSTTNDGTGTGQ